MEPKPSHQFRHTQHEDLHEELTPLQQNNSQAGREFASPEELLRYDAAQLRVPPKVEERLQRSLEQEPAPAKHWWQRWFGR